MKVEIRITQPDALVMAIKTHDGTVRHELWVPEDCGSDMLLPWMLSRIKPLLGSFPFGESDIEIVIGSKLGEKYRNNFNSFAFYLDSTSRFISGLPPHAKGDKTLFVNVSEDMRYRSFYNLLAEKTDALYMNLDLGFNRETRTWGKASFMTVDEFIRFLIDNRVGTVVTVNHYLADRIRYDSGVLLIPVFLRMGVRLVTIENDPPDLRPWGYFTRNFFHHHDWPMFSVVHCLSKEWDVWHKNSNISPIAIPQDYRGKTKPLRDDYRIVMLSNSRWESVAASIEQIEWLFSNMVNPWADLTVWYMAMRRMILGMDLRDYERLYANSILHQFFWLAAQVLKYQAVKALKTDRQIDVYGDVGWQNVCPEYYRGSLDNGQINELFERDDFIVLLANCSYTYLEASGPVFDMMRRGVHWLNLPVAAKTEPLRGMAAIEYRTPEELNALVADIKPAFKRAQNSLAYYRSLLRQSVDGLADLKPSVFWSKELAHHDAEIVRVTDEYAEQNEPLLRACYRMMKLR